MKKGINCFDHQKLLEFCKREGELVKYHKGEQMEHEGYPSQWLAFVVKGYFKYLTKDVIDDKEHITQFSFENELVGDYPGCLYSLPAQSTIEAMTNSHVYRVSKKQLLNMFHQNMETMKLRCQLDEYLLYQSYACFMERHNKTPRERYQLLLQRKPDILKLLSLKDIASYLNITPKTLSIIRYEITFGQ